MGHTPLQLGPIASERGKIRQQGRREEGAVDGLWGECGNVTEKKINPYPCLDASVRPVTLNSSSVKGKMSHLSSVHPELQTFNCTGGT